MQKKKGLKIALYILIPILLIIGIFFYVKAVFLTPKEIPTYSFSGYVYADGMPLSGVTITCDEGTAVTSDKGYYIISGVKEAVSVSASKEGYLIENNLKNASRDNTQIDFEGYKYFDKHGVVENNGNLIANATVKVTSKAGVYTTTTNLYGEFYLPKLAGVVSVEVVSDDTQFFNQTFDINEEELIINGATTISGKLKLNKVGLPSDFELKLNDENVTINEDFSFEINEVSCGDKLSLSSQKYHIDNSQIEIINEGQEIIFDCYKYYTATFNFLSGDTPIVNTEITVNDTDNYVATSSSIVIDKMYGDNSVDFSNGDFKFEELTINNTCNLTVIGYLDVEGIVLSDDNIKGLNIGHNGKDYVAENGKFIIENCQLGDKLEFSSEGYYIDSDEIEVEDNSIVVAKEKLYTLNISASYNQNLLTCSANINGVNYDIIDGILTIDDFHGEGDIQISLDGYVFDNYFSNYDNTSINITPMKIFNLTGVVKSGDIVLDDAIIMFGENSIEVNEFGQFEILNLYSPSEITINCDGYDSKSVSFDVDNCNLNINMEYSIEGYVFCGENPVSNVEILSNGYLATTNKDGYFVLNGLCGENLVEFAKPYYSFESVNVNKYTSLEIATTYSVMGKVETSDGELKNFKVVIISLGDGEKVIQYTNDSGEYVFENLIGEYILAYDENTDIVLKPASYDIAKGGIYNFADKGYAFGGVVTSGGKPVADVLVKAGESETTTNANGEYRFELLTKPCVVNLSKEGYVFDNDNLQVDDSYDLKEDVDFTCSYTVRGVVRSGNVNLDNVLLSIQGKNIYTSDGVFEIDGVTGDTLLTAKLDGYEFGEDIAISGYANVDINGYYSTIILTKTGNVVISGAEVSFGGKAYTTNEEGKVILEKVYGGDSFSIVKDGYNFSTYIFGEYLETNIIDVTYNISGEVINAGVGIVGAIVTIGGDSVVTDGYGRFAIDNLSGENTLTVSKDMFEFKEYIINSPSYIEVVAMFKVSGYVLVDSLPLAGVNVIIAGKNAITNNSGFFEISQIDEESTIVLEKVGYEFGQAIVVNTNKTVTIFATYSLSGVVVTGNIKIAGARVISSNGEETITDSNGRYVLTKLDRVVSIEVIADNYNSFTMENVSSYSNSANINLTYNVELNFTGEYNNIRIGVNNVFKEYSSSKVVLENLSGENIISYNKMGYSFVEDVTGSVICFETRNITISLVYSVSGRVTTSSGYAVPNAVVSAGGKRTITNNNGEYTLEGLSNKLTIRASIENEDCLFEVDSPKQVSFETTCDLIFKDDQYFYYLTMLGYQNLRNSYAYLVVAEGVITPNTSLSGPQNTRVIYRKDGSGKRLSQNLNYGEEINILGMGVDPRVAFLTYYDMASGNIMYKRAEGGDIGSNKIANYAKYTWQTNVSDNLTYLNTFGTRPDGFYPYTILLNSTDKKKVDGEYDGDTISSIKAISQNGDSYTYTIILNAGLNDTTSYYKKQMKYMVPDQDCKGFSKIELKYTITKDGVLKDLIITENYTVESFSTQVNTDATFDYSFNMYNEGDSKIVNIDTSDNGVIKALSLDGVLLSTVDNLKDVIVYKRREDV